MNDTSKLTKADLIPNARVQSIAAALISVARGEIQISERCRRGFENSTGAVRSVSVQVGKAPYGHRTAIVIYCGQGRLVKSARITAFSARDSLSKASHST